MSQNCCIPRNIPPGPWFDLKHEKSQEKVAICMNLYIKCHPEKWHNHPGSWRKLQWKLTTKSSGIQKLPQFFHGKKTRISSRIVDPNFRVGGWTNPSEKYARQIGSFFLGRDENEKYLKPPPSSRFAHELENMWTYEINNYSPNMMIKWVLEKTSKERTHKKNQLPNYLCWFMLEELFPKSFHLL